MAIQGSPTSMQKTLAELQKSVENITGTFLSFEEKVKTAKNELAKDIKAAQEEIYKIESKAVEKGRKLTKKEQENVTRLNKQVNLLSKRFYKLDKAGADFFKGISGRTANFMTFLNTASLAFRKKELKWTQNWYNKAWGKQIIKFGTMWQKFTHTKYYETVKKSWDKITGYAKGMWDELMGPLGKHLEALFAGAKAMYTGAKMFVGFWIRRRAEKVTGEEKRLIEISHILSQDNNLLKDIRDDLKKQGMKRVPKEVMEQTRAKYQQEQLNVFKASGRTSEQILKELEDIKTISGKDFTERTKERLRGMMKPKEGGVFSKMWDKMKMPSFDLGSIASALSGLFSVITKFAGPLLIAWAGFAAFKGIMKGWDEAEAKRLFGDDGFMAKLGSSVSHFLSELTGGIVKAEEYAKFFKDFPVWVEEMLSGVGKSISSGLDKLVSYLPGWVRKMFGITTTAPPQPTAGPTAPPKPATAPAAVPTTTPKSTGAGRTFAPGPTSSQKIATGANKAFSAVKDFIFGASVEAGVDPNLMTKMAGVESGFKATAKAGTSSATGLYQFTTGTWKDMIKKYGSKYGLGAGASRLDPKANALMAAELIKESQEAIKKTTGKTATDTDIYLSHFLGAGGAGKFITAEMKGQGDLFGAALFPAAAKSNPGIFFIDGDPGRPRTLNQIRELLSGRLGKFDLAKVGGPSAVTATEAGKTPITAGSEAVRAAEQEKAQAATDIAKSAAEQAEVSKEAFRNINAPSAMATATTPGGATRQLPEPPTDIMGSQTPMWMLVNNVA